MRKFIALFAAALILGVANAQEPITPIQIEKGVTVNAGDLFSFPPYELNYFRIGSTLREDSYYGVYKYNSGGFANSFSYSDNGDGTYRMSFASALSYYRNDELVSNNVTGITVAASGALTSFTVIKGSGSACDPFFFSIANANNNDTIPVFQSGTQITGVFNPFDFECGKYFTTENMNLLNQVLHITGVDSLTFADDGENNFVIRLSRNATLYQNGKALTDNISQFKIADSDPSYAYVSSGSGTLVDPYVITPGHVEPGTQYETLDFFYDADPQVHMYTGTDVQVYGGESGRSGIHMYQNGGDHTIMKFYNLYTDTITSITCVVNGEGSFNPSADCTISRTGNIITFTNINYASLRLVHGTGDFYICKATIHFKKEPNKTHVHFQPCAESYTSENIAVTKTCGCNNGFYRGLIMSHTSDKITITATDGALINTIKLYYPSYDLNGRSGISVAGATKSYDKKDTYMVFSGLNTGSVDVLSSNSGENVVYFSRLVVSYTPQSPPTAIGETNANANAKATKVLRDGQLLIIHDGKTYNATGAEVR